MLKNVVAEKKYNFKSDTMKGEILEQQGKPTESVWTFLDGAVRVFPGVLLTSQVEIQNTIDALYAYAEQKDKLFNWTHERKLFSKAKMVKVILRTDGDLRFFNPHGWLDGRSRETAHEEYRRKVIDTSDVPEAQSVREFCNTFLRLHFDMTQEQFEATINFSFNFPTIPHWDEPFHDGPGMIIVIFCIKGSGVLVLEDMNGKIRLLAVCEGDVYTFTGIVRLRWSHGVLVGKSCHRITVTCRLGHLSKEQDRQCLVDYQDRYRADAIEQRMTLPVCTGPYPMSSKWAIMVPLEWDCKYCKKTNVRTGWPVCKNVSCNKKETGVMGGSLIHAGKRTEDMDNLVVVLEKLTINSPILLIECDDNNSGTTSIEYKKANKRTWYSIRKSGNGNQLFIKQPEPLLENISALAKKLLVLAMCQLWPDSGSTFTHFVVVSVEFVTFTNGPVPGHFAMFAKGTIFFAFVLKRGKAPYFVRLREPLGQVVKEVQLGTEDFYTCGVGGTRFAHFVSGPERTLLTVGITPTAPMWSSFSENQYLIGTRYNYRVTPDVNNSEVDILEWQDPMDKVCVVTSMLHNEKAVLHSYTQICARLKTKDLTVLDREDPRRQSCVKCKCLVVSAGNSGEGVGGGVGEIGRAHV